MLFALLALASLALMLGTIRAGASVEGGTVYRPAFKTLGDNVEVRVDPSSFKGSDWIDADGVVKPGCPLKADGTIAGGAPGEVAASVVPYAVGVAEGSTDALLDAAPNGDIATRTRGDVVRFDVEGNLGRVLTPDEVSAIESTGRFVLI